MKAPPALLVRLDGPGVRHGRVLLADLLLVAGQVQAACERVARLLTGDSISVRRGRQPAPLREACALDVVAVQPGSFTLGLDLHRDQSTVPGTDLGELALQKLAEGLGRLDSPESPLPSGYDAGVLVAWRDIGPIFEHGVETVELRVRTRTGSADAVYNQPTHQRVLARIRGPERKLRSVEGRLLMADFKELGLRCRIHQAVGPPIECAFDERLANSVYGHLRQFVKAMGEADEDPDTGRIRRLRLTDIEPIESDADPESAFAEEFWCEPTIEELAAEQGIVAAQDLSSLVGAAADLWESDAALESFIAEVRQGRSRDREAERRLT